MTRLAALLLLLPLAAVQGLEHGEEHGTDLMQLQDLGQAVATGLCKLPGIRWPIVSFPNWGDSTPHQPDSAIASFHIDHEEVSQGDAFMQFIEFEGDGLHACHALEDCDPAEELVSVQSLHCPTLTSTHPREMWVLDSGKTPTETTLCKDCAKLLKVHVNEDGEHGVIERRYNFSKNVVTDGSYLNDVRVDTSDFAYITDSNTGAIIVLNLKSGVSKAWKHESMQPKLESHHHFEIQGMNLDNIGKVDGHRSNAVDGIAWSSIDDYLYFKPVLRRHLFRVKAEVLRKGFDKDDGFAAASAAVEDVGDFGFHDGLAADDQGNLWLTDLEKGTIQMRSKAGKVSWLHDPEDRFMEWPAVIQHTEGATWVLTTQEHLMPFLNNGHDLRPGGNRLYRLGDALPTSRIIRRPKSHDDEL